MPKSVRTTAGHSLGVVYQLWYTPIMSQPGDNRPVLSVVFYATAAGAEPVREWLLELGKDDRRVVGVDIKTAQHGWPLGMPLIRKLEPGLWEVRSSIDSGIARVIFTVEGQRMVLLHGFIKKSQKTPEPDLKLARQRLSDLRKG
jgi:phage-related protein